MVSWSVSGCFQGFVRSKNDFNLVRIALSKEFNPINLISLGIDFPNENLIFPNFSFFKISDSAVQNNLISFFLKHAT